MDYHAYIKSPEWKALSEAVVMLAGWRCRTCNSDGPILQAHHRTYDRLGHEDMDDLTCLCSRCHILFHAVVNKPSRPSDTGERKGRKMERVRLAAPFIADLVRCNLIETASIAFDLPLFSGKPRRWIGKGVPAGVVKMLSAKIAERDTISPTVEELMGEEMPQDPEPAPVKKRGKLKLSRSTFKYREWKAGQQQDGQTCLSP